MLTTLLSSCGSLTSGSYDLSKLPDHYTQVALLLPLQGPYKGPGTAIRDGFLAGYYADMQQNGQQTQVRVYDSGGGKDIRQIYAQAVAEGAQMVVGPLIKNHVYQLARNGNITVPTLALNYTDATFQTPPLFFQFGISPLNEAAQIARNARDRGLSKALIIAPDTAWAQNIAQAFADSFRQSGGRIVDTLNYQPGQNMRDAISHLLRIDSSEDRGQKLQQTLGEKISFVARRRQDVDMIFLIAQPQAARQILPLLRFYYAGDLPTYSLSMIYRGTPNPNYYRDMDDVIFPDIPWTLADENTAQKNFAELWPHNYQSYARLYALGLDAYMLTQNLKRLPSNPDAGLSGRTGQLYLGANNRILQKFIWLRFKNGEVVPAG